MIDFMSGIEDREIPSLRSGAFKWPEDKAVCCVYKALGITSMMFCANVKGMATVVTRFMPDCFDWRLYAVSESVQISVNEELNNSNRR